MNLRIDHATLIAHRGGRPVVLPDYSILIEDNVIRRVGPTAELAAGGFAQCTAEATGHPTPIGRPTQVIDASKHLVFPGLVNTHHHLFQSLTRCMKSVQDEPLFGWLTRLYQRWKSVRYEDVKLAAQISLAEMLLSGCTTSNDHFYLFPRGSDVRIEAILEAADSLGMRFHACRGSMSVGASKGGLPPDECIEDEDRIIADCERALAQFHDPAKYAMRRIDLAPCAPFNVSAELSRATVAMARRHGVLLHTHAAETLDEERYCLDHYKMRPIEWLESIGWLGPDVYLAHCVHLSDADIARLAATGTAVAHCPCSNMRLASGIPPVRKLLDAGVRIGLGVDGSSSNDGGHLLAEARQAMLLQRVCGGAQAMSVAEAFTMATLGGASVLRRPELGNIEEGCAADIVMYRRDDVSLAGAVEQDPLGALMLCHVHRADRVIINGRTVVQDGQVTMPDLPLLVDRFNRLVRDRYAESQRQC